MNISAIEHNKNFDITTHPSLNKAARNAPEESAGSLKIQDETSGPVTSVSNEIVGGQVDNTNDVRGVLRNLQEGHFKGVADVRLRINFNDEITAMDQAKAEQVAEEGVTGLVDSINSQITSLLQTEEFDDETSAAISDATEIFVGGASQLANGLMTKDGPGIKSLMAQMQSTFDELTVSLGAIFTPAVDPETEGPAEIPIEPVEDVIVNEETPVMMALDAEPVDVVAEFNADQFLADLMETFITGLGNLESSLNEISVLPELSQPEGNGKAYDKFLAIYNEIRGMTGTPEQPDIIDTEV